MANNATKYPTSTIVNDLLVCLLAFDMIYEPSIKLSHNQDFPDKALSYDDIDYNKPNRCNL